MLEVKKCRTIGYNQLKIEFVSIIEWKWPLSILNLPPNNPNMDPKEMKICHNNKPLL